MYPVISINFGLGVNRTTFMCVINFGVNDHKCDTCRMKKEFVIIFFLMGITKL
jgi:hypothetical protein